jgi:hypothetical protein
MEENNNNYLKEEYTASKILPRIISIFENLDYDSKLRVLKSIIEIYDIKELKTNSHISKSHNINSLDNNDQEINKSFFTENRVLSPKEFIITKEPQTDVEKVACLAYYLNTYRDQPYFKTMDISNLNTEAAQRKFSNAAKAVDNAYKYGYLVTATKGNKQLSAEGEKYVQLLPNREAAKEVMQKQRRKLRKYKKLNTNDDVDQ